MQKFSPAQPGSGGRRFGAGTLRDTVSWGARLKLRLTGLRLAALFRISWITKATKVAPVDAAMIPEDGSQRATLPLYLSPVVAGFPSPAEDYLDRKLDLHEHLVCKHAVTCKPENLGQPYFLGR
jgi:hypothetical protein